jgi:hypothetical protein
MSKQLVNEVANYLVRQNKLASRKTVYRQVVFAVFEEKYDWRGDGRALSFAVMNAAAQLAGGRYVSEAGRARVEF